MYGRNTWRYLCFHKETKFMYYGLYNAFNSRKVIGPPKRTGCVTFLGKFHSERSLETCSFPKVHTYVT